MNRSIQMAPCDLKVIISGKLFCEKSINIEDEILSQSCGIWLTNESRIVIPAFL
jgi:hypothetical protein